MMIVFLCGVRKEVEDVGTAALQKDCLHCLEDTDVADAGTAVLQNGC